MELHKTSGESAADAVNQQVGVAPDLVAIHACIPGRVRWRLRGLRGNPALKARIEDGLLDISGVHSASASTDTGNLLVVFDPVVPVEHIAWRIMALVRGDVTSSPKAQAWHARPAEAVVSELGASHTGGLTTDAARKRLREQGTNILPPPASRSGFEIFVSQFQTLPVGLLTVAGLFSLFTGGLVEAAAILSVVAANGVLGAVVENRSERTIQSLTTARHERVQAVRDGVQCSIPPETVVPGDLIILRPGMVVPADARVIVARDLRVGEAMLTGESMPVAKQAGPVDNAAALAERASMVYRGTAVTGGSGIAIVVATGSHTEVGRIQRLVGHASARPTPLQRDLDHLGSQIVWASLASCVAVMGIGAMRGIALFQVVRTGVALAVAAIPEGLPVVATTTLTLGIEDMRHQGVLVRRLDAVETLASVRVVCFDKTGTLTLNQMRVTEVVSGGQVFDTGPDGRLVHRDGQPVTLGADPVPRDPLAWLLRIGALCSDVELAERDDWFITSGSATEGALVRLALDADLDVMALRAAHPRLSARHRSAGYRFMATVHGKPGDATKVLIAVKGSPAEVLALCAWDLCDGVRHRMTTERRESVLEANQAMAAKALRVLGFAFGEASQDVLSAIESGAPSLPVADLTWVGLAGMADPVRPGTRELMRVLQSAGVRTVMMTGDQVATARAVASQLGLAANGLVEVFDVADLDRLEGDALIESVRRAQVFARVSPAQKLHLVRALQANGAHVAMIGDGINDSPALKAADVGIAMGGAASSEAAREIADVVLRMDDLAALATAVERGRTTYINVRKGIHYLLATNLSEILVVLGATAAGLAEPLTAMQLLWINLVSDVLPSLGLAFEPPEPGLMQRPPNGADIGIIRRRDFGRLGIEGTMIAGGSLAALAWGTARHGAGPQTRTMAFGSLVVAQLLHAFTARSERQGLLIGGTDELPANRPLTGLLMASAALQALALLVPGVRNILGIVALGPLDLAVTAAAGALPYLTNEAMKAGRRKADGAQIDAISLGRA